MMSPDGTVAELDKLGTGHLTAVCTGFELFLFHTTLIDFTASLMFYSRAIPTSATTAVAALILKIVNARTAIETTRSGKFHCNKIIHSQPTDWKLQSANI